MTWSARLRIFPPSLLKNFRIERIVLQIEWPLAEITTGAINSILILVTGHFIELQS